jgi:hypothetical protein
MPRVRFSLSLTEQQYLDYYRGRAKIISVLAEDGQRIEFPAQRLRPFVTHRGIQGRFELYFDEQQKLVKLEKLD